MYTLSFVKDTHPWKASRNFCSARTSSFPRSATASTHWGPWHRGLFCSLLIGTILNTLGSQFHIDFLTAQIAEKVPYTVGGLTSFMSGPAMAIAIGYALQAPPLVLFSLAAVGYACNLLGGAGGPLAVLFVAIIAAECGKAVSKETKIDILVTPIVTTLIGRRARPTSLRRPSARRPAPSVRSSCRPRRSSPS